MHRCAGILLLFMLVGCESSAARFVRISVVDHDGQSPTRGAGQIRFQVAQGAGETSEVEGTIAGGEFDVPFTIESYGAPTRIQTEITSETRRLVGSIPTFIPGLTLDARIVVGEPGTCAPLALPQLEFSRLNAGFVGIDANFFLLGGTTLDGAESVDTPEAIVGTSLTSAAAITSSWLDPLAIAPRESKAIRLGSERVILISEQGALRIDVLTPSVEAISVHRGANQHSALVATSSGVAVVGGGTASEPVAGITWIPSSGNPSESTLSTPRYRSSAIWIADTLMVAGGQLEGESLFERARLGEDGVAFGGETRALSDPTLIRDPSATEGRLLGGSLDDGTIATTGAIIRNCPDCGSESASSTFEPRARPMLVETASGTWLLGGEGSDGESVATVERAIWSETDFRIVAQGPLDVPRRGASAAELASGIVLIAGGTLDSVGLRTLTVCWPGSELDTL